MEMKKLWEVSKKLNDVVGVSSHEQEARKVMRELVGNSVDEFEVDNLGTLYCTKKGKDDHPTIILAGHLDEIGFCVKEITKDGFIKFAPLGGWWGGVMLAQVVDIHTHSGKVYRGVIGSKPPHVLSAKEREVTPVIKNMFIDCGFKDKEAVEKAGIRIGDIISKSGEAFKIEDDNAVGKAWDDRIGAAVIVGVLEDLKGTKTDATIIGAGTSQEEVGIRGATVAASYKQADVSIALDVCVAGDQPGMDQQQHLKLGEGVVIGFGDGRALYNRNLVNKLIDICDKEKIAYNLSAPGPGGTDAGALQYTSKGSLTITLSIPSRYIHSHTEVINMRDVDAAIKLITSFCKWLNKDTIKELQWKE